MIDYINEEALKYYKLKEDIIPSELLRKVEKFIVLKTIDEKWRNHLLGMDQLREGIGLRAYGQKNPLIEYKSESYNFFQELMVSLRATVIQRVFHAQVSDQVQVQQNPLQKNIQLQHDEVAKNDKNEIPNEVNQQHDSSNNSELKLGRNDKVELISPSGERVKVKFKKIDQYLMKGYTRG